MPHRLLLFVAFALTLAACGKEIANEAPPAAADAAAAAPASAPEPATTATPPAEPGIEAVANRGDTLASLKARLGAANVTTETLDAGEGETISGWLLFPSDPTRRLEVYLDESGEHPDTLVAQSTSTHWTRADGVRVGMTVAELQALNGKAFGFLGFDWDYGGAVTNWRGGKLDPGEGPHGSVTLCLPEKTPEDYPIGDSEFSSDDVRLKDSMPTVCEFTVLLPKVATEAAAR